MRPAAWRSVVLLSAVAAGLALCLPDLLMAGYRRFHQARLPEVAAAWDLDGGYEPNPQDGDTFMHATRAAQIARGGLFADQFSPDGRNPALASRDGLSFGAMALAFKALGPRGGWLALRFLGGVLCFLLFYALVAALSGNREWSLLAAAAFSLFFDLPALDLFAVGPLTWLKESALRLFWSLGKYPYFFGVSRVPRPALTIPPFLLALLLAGRMRDLRGALLAGTAAGALCYVHTDVWLVGAGALGVLVLLRRLETGRPPRLELAAAGAAALVSLPWVLLHAAEAGTPEMSARAEFFFGRAPDFTGLVYLAAAALAWLRLPRDPLTAVLAAGLAAAGLGLQLQVVWGKNFAPIRWQQPGLVCLLGLALGAAGRAVRASRDWPWAAAVLLAIAIGRSANYAAQRFPFQSLPARVERALAWLDANAAPGATVAALGPQESILLATWTHCRPLVPTAFLLHTDLPLSEVVRRLRRALELYGIGEHRYLSALEEKGAGVGRVDADLWRGRVDWTANDWAMAPFIGAPREVSLAEWKAQSGRSAGSETADYLWVGAMERSLLPDGAERRLGAPVFRDGDLTLYRTKVPGTK